jgi:hypothetical protein
VKGWPWTRLLDLWEEMPLELLVDFSPPGLYTGQGVPHSGLAVFNEWQHLCTVGPLPQLCFAEAEDPGLSLVAIHHNLPAMAPSPGLHSVTMHLCGIDVCHTILPALSLSPKILSVTVHVCGSGSLHIICPTDPDSYDSDEVDIPVACLFQWGDNAEILLRLAGSFAFKP